MLDYNLIFYWAFGIFCGAMAKASKLEGQLLDSLIALIKPSNCRLLSLS